MKSEIMVFRWNECDYLHKSCPIEWKSENLFQIINYNLQLVFCLFGLWSAVARGAAVLLLAAAIRESVQEDTLRPMLDDIKHTEYLWPSIIFLSVLQAAHIARLFAFLSLNCSVRCCVFFRDTAIDNWMVQVHVSLVRCVQCVRVALMFLRRQNGAPHNLRW